MRTLGVNTGTSVDGVDMCLVHWNEVDLRKFEIIKQRTFPFPNTLKQHIEKVINTQRASLEEIANLTFDYTNFISDLIIKFRDELIEDSIHKLPSTVRNEKELIDLVGIHGQTIFHGPQSTWQIGDGSVIANKTGIITVSDFRPADIALGGGGAPLISFIDDTLVRNEKESVGTLNIGGIANTSIMELGKDTIAYDTGPGNTLIDSLVKKLFHKPFDKDGEIAFEGKVDEKFVNQIIRQNSYFKEEPPKTTGREYFCEKFADKFLDLGKKENIISTVSYFTVKTISNELKKFDIKKVYASGGGTQNKFLIEGLKKENPDIEFLSHELIGIDDQYKESMLFSLLAYTSFKRIPNNIPSSTGANAATILGKISYVPIN